MGTTAARLHLRRRDSRERLSPHESCRVLDLSLVLASLGGDVAMIILAGMCKDLDAVLQSAVQSIGESNGESRGEKIDIQLQIPLRVEATDD